MQEYYLNDRIIAKSGQKELYTQLPIIEKAVLVYLNGSLLDKERDYQVKDQFCIKMKDSLKENDIVVITSILSDNRLKVSVVSNNSYTSSSLFKKYGTKTKLKLNSTYFVNIGFKKEMINWKFSTKLDPLLSTVKKIRIDTGDLLESVSDENILRVLYSNSKEAIDKYNSLKEDEYSFEASKTLPKYLKNWVRYKTDIDLCYSVYLTLTGKSGASLKKIGVIQIDNKIKLPYLTDMLSEFKRKFEEVNLQLKKSEGVVSSFVKAKNTNYPINDRMMF